MAASVGHPEVSRTTFISDLGSQSIQRIIFLSSPLFFFNFSVIEARGGVCIDLFIQGDLRGPACEVPGPHAYYRGHSLQPSLKKPRT